MAQPLTVDQLTAGVRPYPLDYWKQSVGAKAQGSYHDLFLVPGFPLNGLAATTAGRACNSSTPGAIPMSATPGGKQTWLIALNGSCSLNASFTLYDRLVDWGGLSATFVGPQALGAIALPRYTDGYGVLPFLEYYSPTGATASNATISYTNELGVSGRTSTVAMGVTTVNGQTIPIPLQAGDFGVRSIQNVTLSASTGTAGSFGVFLGRRLARIGGLGGENRSLDWLGLGMPEVVNGACLSFLELVSTTFTGAVDFTLNVADV